MKKNYLLSFVAFSTIAVAFGVTSAHAAAALDQQKNTPTVVTIQDDTDTKADPTAPNEKLLTLEKVPSNYNFESKLQNNQYAIASGTITDGSIDVFNDTIARDWSVKASVDGNTITRNGDSKTFAVTSFKVNDQELTNGTGVDGIVAKAQAAKTDTNNTGVIKTSVTAVSIGFTDTDKALRVNDKLAGKIDYQLFNTADAQ